MEESDESRHERKLRERLCKAERKAAELRAENEKLKEDLKHLLEAEQADQEIEAMAEADDLRAENEKLDEALTRYDKMWRASDKSAAKAWLENKKLKVYAQHLPSCNTLAPIRLVSKNGKPIGCDCGLNEALKGSR